MIPLRFRCTEEQCYTLREKLTDWDTLTRYAPEVTEKRILDLRWDRYHQHREIGVNNVDYSSEVAALAVVAEFVTRGRLKISSDFYG
jgi:hypothetical protein